MSQKYPTDNLGRVLREATDFFYGTITKAEAQKVKPNAQQLGKAMGQSPEGKRLFRELCDAFGFDGGTDLNEALAIASIVCCLNNRRLGRESRDN